MDRGVQCRQATSLRLVAPAPAISPSRMCLQPYPLSESPSGKYSGQVPFYRRYGRAAHGRRSHARGGAVLLLSMRKWRAPLIIQATKYYNS
jgi:hypothetical protein